MEDLEQIARFSDPYEREYLESAEAIDGSDTPFQLRFFLKNAMAGARHESTSASYRKAAEEAIHEYHSEIEQYLNGTGDFPDEAFEDALVEAGLTNGADRKMVIELIDVLADLDDDHIIDYTVERIEEGDIDTVYDRLTGIHNIAQKKAALFLRDVVAIRGLEREVSWDEYRYVFPVDTQVRQVVENVGVVDEGRSRAELIDSVLDACEPDVSPIAFNQGAWYLGANAFDIVVDNLGVLEPS